MFEKAAKELSVGFVGLPQDIAEAYLYAVRADYATGTTIVIGKSQCTSHAWNQEACAYLLTYHDLQMEAVRYDHYFIRFMSRETKRMSCTCERFRCQLRRNDQASKIFMRYNMMAHIQMHTAPAHAELLRIG